MSKVAREVAEDDFERMCASRRITTDPEDLDPDDYESLLATKKKVVRAIMAGDVVVTEDGDPVFTPPVPGAKPLRFYKPTGATLIAMDPVGREVDGQQARVVRAMAEMTRTPKGEFSKLEAPDYTLCTQLCALFLAGR